MKSQPNQFKWVIGMMALMSTVLVRADSAPPWAREESLREGAKKTSITSTLHPTSPQPGAGAHPVGPAMQISNPAIRATLWGPVHHITVSLLKNDIWDRRVPPVKFTAPTLAEIIAGAKAPVNAAASDINPRATSTRPANWAYWRKEGGKFSPYHDGPRYSFPTAKPTGQIILAIDALANAPQPELAQSCADAGVRFRAGDTTAGAELEYLLSMERNVVALRGVWSGQPTPAALRLYRHRDTAHYAYMTPAGDAYKDGPKKAAYEADQAWNGPLAAPEAGQDGQYFWIRQSLPAEKTFPRGFDYVMMGMIVADQVKLATAAAQTGLGTPVPEINITAAPGAAATASFRLERGARFTAYVVTVTTNDTDAGDLLAEARNRLAAAERAGFDGLAAENTRWYAALYDRREAGRIFVGGPGREVSDDIREIFNSWYCRHDGATRTDMRKYQASAHYVVPEKDAGMYGSLPCYNEVFYTPEAVRNRTDSTLMWKQIVEHWFEAAKLNARETYGLPGMYITHGYLPPIKADRYAHTNVALELAVDTMAQVLKTLWDEWDYGGDPKVLEEIYPYLREMAVFYAAYAQKEPDGFYHITPSMQEESWGIQPGFSHNRDCLAALATFRWGLTRAAEAASLLGRDEGLRWQWREVAEHLAPYPMWEKKEGLVYAGVRGVEPWRSKGDHPWDVGTYPAVLTDDINLDSSALEREIMVRTARVLPAELSDRAEILVGSHPPEKAGAGRRDGMGPASSAAPYVQDPERLLNSRSGRIHLFPLLPPGAGPVAFRHWQARGGFLVSAAYEHHAVTVVEISSRRDLPCQLMNPWPGCGVAITDTLGRPVPFELDNRKGECLVFPTRRGVTYRIACAATLPASLQQPSK